MTTRWRDLTIVLGVTAATIALRVGELSPTSLFVDDQWVAYIDRVGFGDSAQIGLTSVGFVAGLKAWFNVVGFSETSAQLPAFLAGCCTPGLLYVVIRRWIGWPFGLLAACLLTFNQVHISYSYHVKQYTFDGLWSTVCLAFAVGLTRRGLSARLSLIAVAASLVAAAISFTTVISSFGLFALIAWLIASDLLKTRSAGMSSDDPPNGAAEGKVIAGVAMLASGIALLAWYIILIRPNVTEGVRDYWADHYVDRRRFVTSLQSLASRYVELIANTFNLDPRGVMAVLASVLCLLLISWALVQRPVPMIAVGVPIALAGGLAYLGLAPLGGGRTDLHLIVLVIAGVMGGLDVALRALADRLAREEPNYSTDPVSTRLATLSMLALTGVLTAIVLLVDRPEPRPYPDNDASRLVQVIDDQRLPSEAVVLHRSVYAYGLYSERSSRPVSDGYHYAPRFAGDELVARLRWATDAPSHVDALGRVAEATDGIWLLSSPIGGPQQLDDIGAILGEQLGFELDNRIVGRNAILDHWVRQPADASDASVDDTTESAHPERPDP